MYDEEHHRVVRQRRERLTIYILYVLHEQQNYEIRVNKIRRMF